MNATIDESLPLKRLLNDRSVPSLAEILPQEPEAGRSYCFVQEYYSLGQTDEDGKTVKYGEIGRMRDSPVRATR